MINFFKRIISSFLTTFISHVKHDLGTLNVLRVIEYNGRCSENIKRAETSDRDQRKEYNRGILGRPRKLSLRENATFYELCPV